MNKVILIGRLTKNPELKYTSSNNSVCSFTIAVQRPFKDASGERKSDFINCVAWKNSAEVIAKYFSKGSRIGIIGNIQTSSYDDQNGKKVYVTEVVVEGVEFLDTKSESGPTAETTNEVLPIPPMPKNNGDEVLAHMEKEADAAEAEATLPFDLPQTFDF